MSDGKSSGDDKSQAGGAARATAAVGTAAVGRAVVPGEEAPPSTPKGSGKPAGGAPATGGQDKPAGGSSTGSASVPGGSASAGTGGGSAGSGGGQAGSGGTPPKAPAGSGIAGSLRPSVVNSGQSSSGTSVPPVPPPLNSSLRAASGAPVKPAGPQAPSGPGTGAGASAAGSAKPVGSAVPPVAGAQPTAVRPASAPPSAAAGRTSVMGMAGSGSAGAASVAAAAAPVSAPAAGVGAGAASGTARTQVGEAVRNVRATVAAAASRGPRRARLQLKKIDPWSVMKFSFAASLVLFIVSVVATALLYTVLDAMDVFDSLNKTIGSLTATADQAGDAGGEEFVITAKLVIGSAALLGAVNMVLFTALATLGAFVYNVCADLVGGVEVTLAERD